MSSERREFPAAQLSATRWSVVGRAADVDEQIRRQALTELLARYLPALRSHVVYRMKVILDIVTNRLVNFHDELLPRIAPGNHQFESALDAVSYRVVEREKRPMLDLKS